jgi:hypothetical protein
MVGCFTKIRRDSVDDPKYAYHVSIIPTRYESPFNLILTMLTRPHAVSGKKVAHSYVNSFYKLSLADGCLGILRNHPVCTPQDEKSRGFSFSAHAASHHSVTQALSSAICGKGSVLYADQVSSVDNVSPRPLYSLGVSSPAISVNNGFILSL